MEIEELHYQLETARKHNYSLRFLADGFQNQALKLISISDEQCDYCEGSGVIVIDSRETEAECPACAGFPLGECSATLVMVGDDREHVVPVCDIEIYNKDLCPCGDINCDWQAT